MSLVPFLQEPAPKAFVRLGALVAERAPVKSVAATALPKSFCENRAELVSTINAMPSSFF